MKYTEIGALIGSAKGGGVSPMAVAPLRLTNTGSDVATIAFNDIRNAGTVLSIRRNEKKEFLSWDFSAVTLQPGEYIEVVGENTQLTTFMGKFEMTGTSISGSGSVMSILYGDDITEGENLIMPGRQFEFHEGQPYGLFINCTSLATAPELPATTLATGCYRNMFKGCTSLTTAPELPATTLTDDCYGDMFYGCTSLATAPELPATTLANGCCGYMFYNCTSLASVSVAFTSWDEENSATSDWLNNVAATGTFTCPAGLDTTTRDSSHVPENWTVVNA